MNHAYHQSSGLLSTTQAIAINGIAHDTYVWKPVSTRPTRSDSLSGPETAHVCFGNDPLTCDSVRRADWHDEDAHGQIGDGQAHDEHIGNL